MKAKIQWDVSFLALVRPVYTLVFAHWLGFTWISAILDALGWANALLLLAGWFLLSLGFAFWRLEYGRREEFEGMEIQVREPKVTFGGMHYNFDKDDLGDSVFCQIFFMQLSALLVPFETSVHMCMGHDGERASEEDEHARTCEGMMKQETNHGQCQLLYSRGAEDKVGYPSGWRQLWKTVILTVFPLPLRQAFVAWLEAGFIAMTSLIATMPSLYDRLFAEPKWVFAWHLTEESEHCWDSVPDMLHRCPRSVRIVMWIATWHLLPLQMGPLALLEGLAYGRHALLKSPSTFCWSFFMWAVFLPNFFMYSEACTLLHIVCGLRPSDAAYHRTKTAFHTHIFAPYKSQFKVTHFQNPQEHLRSRTSSLKSAAFQVVAGIRLRNAATAVGRVRKQVYSQTIQSLKAGGMTMAEIQHAGLDFGSNDELVTDTRLKDE
eukprot:TRINITY_DN218_c0_g1_i8.p1 TRINITY_DN218_c0_g1~~TRINITY_DN218_c0_g1_i8.p1  ORF type:complete len:434 (+),score=114.14 TRINITY_DN218_c0_g1_i8:356-1657(+)